MASRAAKDDLAHFEGPRAPAPSERRSALKLLNSVLRPDGPSDILREYPLVLSEKNSDNMRVIVKRKEVVSHAAIYFSHLCSGELTFRVGGIGSVATHPAYRGRGFAGAILRDCMRIMQENACQLSVLWTQRMDFYRTLGYEMAGSEFLFRAKASDFARIPCSCEIVPFSSRYLPAIEEIHEREGLRTLRTLEEYEAYFTLPKATTLLATKNGTVTAYAVMGKGEDFRFCIHEWGGDTDDLLCLVREFAASSSIGEVLVLTPAARSEFTRRLEQLQLPKTFEYLAMMRVIDIQGLSALLQDHVSQKIGKQFGISDCDSGVRIRIGPEEALIQAQYLVRVLFGPDSASSILPSLTQDTRRILEKAFPIPLFIWGLDSV
jgi:N-acetylglutamate synthase-like GNAT family acetyltransferase